MHRDRPVLKSNASQVSEIRRALIGASVSGVWYRQTRSGGLGSIPDRDTHEVDLDIVMMLTGGIIQFTWERDDRIEGMFIDFPAEVGPLEDIVSVRVDKSPQWRAIIGDRIRDVRFGWYKSELGVPTSLLSVRVQFENDREALLAVGELDQSEKPRYHPDSLIVIFDERLARSYRPEGTIGTPWDE